MATVFLNGRFVPADEARVSIFDAGLQHGVGLFETLLGGKNAQGEPWAFRLDEHVERLIRSARELGFSDHLRGPALAKAVLSTISRSDLARARVRLTITGGDLNLLGRTRSESRPGDDALQATVLIVAQPATEYPPEMFSRGITATLADLRLNPLDPFESHKTINYWARLRELQAAAAKHAGEALVFQVSNHLAGGCVSNAFLVKDGRLLTPIARGEEGAGDDGHKSGPPVPSPVLPGITRAWIMEWARGQGIEARARMLTISDVLASDEVFLTNSSWGVLPVARVEKEAIGAGEPGPITLRAREAWLAESSS